jgi:hypothetical protein
MMAKSLRVLCEHSDCEVIHECFEQCPLCEALRSQLEALAIRIDDAYDEINELRETQEGFKGGLQ